MARRCIAAGLIALGTVWLLAGQTKVTQVELRTVPAEARVRPTESIVVQLLAFGEGTTASGAKGRVRVAPAKIQFSLKSGAAGWISKPFRYQGEDEPFYGEQSDLGSLILGQVTGGFLVQDCVLFSASEQSGQAVVTATADGLSASLTIKVDAQAASRKTEEQSSFPDEPSDSEPGRALAEHYAPLIAQETWFHPKADYLARFDFDDNWRGDDNWRHADTGSSQAFVYYSVTETETHWFLLYNLIHPRDYSDRCVAGTCHENDSEGLVLTVAKDGSARGRLLAMETLAHNNVYSFRADARVQGNTHDLDGELELADGSHPVVFVESGGHGIYGTTSNYSRYRHSRETFSGGTGVTYVYKGRAESPRHPNDRNGGYELLSARLHFWNRAHPGGRGEKAFDDYFTYQPFGGRPPAQYARLAGAFYGREQAENSAKPFWGWHDERSLREKTVARGQWGLDPAYAGAQNLRFPNPYSLNYVYNPYLQSGGTSAGSSGSSGSEPAGGNLPPADQSLQPRRDDGYDLTARQGRCDIRLQVDEAVEVYLYRDRIYWRVQRGRTPEDRGSAMTQPLPADALKNFKLERKDGRGEIRLLEPPSADNDYTAVLLFQDSRGGSDRYHARLTWERETAVTSSGKPAPASRVPRRGSLPGIELYSSDNRPLEYTQEVSGVLEFRGRVDGSVVLRVRGDRLFAEVISGQPVKVERFRFSQPLPAVVPREIDLAREDGRGSVVLIERPSSGNAYTAVIRVDDPKGGDDRYHFRLIWKR